MQFIKPYEEIYGLVPLFTDETKFDCQKFMEQCGRTCYKSEEKITNESCIKFTEKIVERRHLTVIEHSNMVFKIKLDVGNPIVNYWKLKARASKYMNVYMEEKKPDFIYIGGNLRAWMEHLDEYSFDHIVKIAHHWLAEVLSLSPFEIEVCRDNMEIPVDLRRLTVKFVHDRAFSHELVRHRLCVFSQESQRYVRYDGTAIFIIPFQYRGGDCVMPTEFVDSVENSYIEYQRQRSIEKQPPEFARTILPNCTKTEVVTTCDWPEWKHIFFLRAPKSAHPDMQESMARIQKPITDEIALGVIR